MQALLRSVKSMHILILPFFLGTRTTFASHSGYIISLMTFTSRNLCTSALAAKILSSDIFLCLWFLGLIFGSMSNECCIMSLVTPCSSEALQAKMSWFFYSTFNNCISSSLVRVAAMVILLSNTTSSRGMHFVSSWSARSIFPFGISGGCDLLLAWSQ